MSIEPNKVYLPEEVAELLRCSRANVYELMKSGELGFTLIGARKNGRRIMGRAVLDFLEARSEGGPSPKGAFKHLKIGQA